MSIAFSLMGRSESAAFQEVLVLDHQETDHIARTEEPYASCALYPSPTTY